jgi:hypothetical protein
MTSYNPANRFVPAPETGDLLARSALYREWLAEREEILRHKWIESEKAGGDIGFERALVNWVIHHRANWRATRRQLVVAFSENVVA